MAWLYGCSHCRWPIPLCGYVRIVGWYVDVAAQLGAPPPSPLFLNKVYDDDNGSCEFVVSLEQHSVPMSVQTLHFRSGAER